MAVNEYRYYNVYLKFCNYNDKGANYDEIKEAVKSASHNLYSRHRIDVCDDLKYFSSTNDYCFTIKVPKSLGIPSNNHFRGVSAYLLKTYPEKYKILLQGTRLFLYMITEG